MSIEIFQKAVADAAKAEVSTEILAQLESMRECLQQLVREEFNALVPRPIELVSPQNVAHVLVGVQHKQFDKLMHLLSLGMRVYIVGPAGSGKTHACGSAAKGLDQKMVAESFCIQSSKTEISGYQNAQGGAVLSKFRQAVENGWLYVADEIDSANANIVTVMNMVLASSAGDMVPFPDGMVEIHEDFRFVATANTYGRGASREYVGRNPLDAASLDRFVMLEWGYDDVLEDEIARQKGVPISWVEHVRKVRGIIDELKIRQVVSPRATINGGLMMASGAFTFTEVEEMVLFKGLDEAAVAKIRAKLGIVETIDTSNMSNLQLFEVYVRERTAEMLAKNEWQADKTPEECFRGVVGAAIYIRETGTDPTTCFAIVRKVDVDEDVRFLTCEGGTAKVNGSYLSYTSNTFFQQVNDFEHDIASHFSTFYDACIGSEHMRKDFEAWKDARGKPNQTEDNPF